jgi:hypothetical protein
VCDATSAGGVAAKVDGEEVAVVAGDVRDGFSAGGVVATVDVDGEEVAVVAGDVRDGFSAGGVAATVDCEEVAVVAGDVRDGFSAGGVAATVDGEEVAVVVGEVRDSFSPDGAVVTVVAEAVTADDGGVEDVVSAFGTAAPFVKAVESAGGGTGDVVFAGADVAVKGGVLDAFAAGVIAAPVVVEGMVPVVTDEVRDPVTAGGAGTTDGAVSVIARFGVEFGSTDDGTTVSLSPTTSMIRRSGSRSVNEVARNVVARSNTTRTVPASN